MNWYIKRDKWNNGVCLIYITEVCEMCPLIIIILENSHVPWNRLLAEPYHVNLESFCYRNRYTFINIIWVNQKRRRRR